MDVTLFQRFITFSADLTGFAEFTLYGTGRAQEYFDTVQKVIGTELFKELLNVYRDVIDQPADKDSLLRTKILSSEKYGPIARNIIKLWYVSIWFELPADWREKFGPLVNDDTFVVSAYAYTEGLLGPAVGAHPQGAKPPGYGTWAYPPEIPKF